VKSRRSGLRATRLAAPTDQVDRGAPVAERHSVTYWCARDHVTSVIFSVDVETPSSWDCCRCGGPASPEQGNAAPVTPTRWFPRTPYEFLMMRRTPEDGERLLAEALEALQARRQRRP